jgi:filamentous hemagglutinin family protein
VAECQPVVLKNHKKKQGVFSMIKLHLTRLAVALAACGPAFAATPAANQLPTGARVTAGQASVSQSGAAALTVNQSSASAVINWQTFNLGSSASVNFVQPSASSATLNRVLDSNPSQIFGRITAPGQVFFSNPNGMYFAPGASVEVGSLAATTHSISDADFMAGAYRFTRNGANGSIVNEGQLQAGLGGYIALLAPQVRNQGVVVAQLGTVALAAGEAYALQMQGNQLANVRVTPGTLQALVENGNAVRAPGGLIILSAQAADQLRGSVVRSSGELAANGLGLRNGRVVLDAGADGTVQVSGRVQANQSNGNGGQISLSGRTIELQNGARLEAMGSSGGGSVLVGGDWQGSGTLAQATTVRMDGGASIDASATQQGNGGRVVLWSDVRKQDSQTTAGGSISARGGAQGGAGGQVETSGHQLDVSGLRVNAGATHGAAGQWLLDPFDYTIDLLAANAIMNGLQLGASVTVSTNTNNPGFGSAGNPNGGGDITLNSNIVSSALEGAPALTLDAGRNIVLNANISVGPRPPFALPDSKGVVGYRPLDVTLHAAGGSISGAGNINTGGGLLTLNQTGTGVMSGVIGGSGAVSKLGSGTVVFTGNNTYSGGTTISEGSLQIGNDGTSGSLGSGFITNNGALVYKRSDATTFTNLSGGSGSFTQAGSGKLTVTNGGYIGSTGTVTINRGSQMQMCNGDTHCSMASLDILVNGELIYNDAENRTITKSYRGDGRLSFVSAYTTTLTGTSNFSGLTSIAAGATLQLGNGGTTGTLGTGAIAVEGGLVVNHSNTVALANAISGSGSLAQIGTGTTILTGNNSYGRTTISAGTLQVGNGGSSGTLGLGDVSNNASLVFLRGADTTIANTISGSGNVRARIGGNLTVGGSMNQGSTIDLQATQGLQVLADLASAGGTTLHSGGNMGLHANIRNSGSGAITLTAGDGTQASGASLRAAPGATIVQNANADVLLSTDGQGDLTPARIVKTGTGGGNIVLAAGRLLAAGNGAGGQLKPLAGNTVSNAGTGTLYVYSGSFSTTGNPALLSAGFYPLTYEGAAPGSFNTAYGRAYGDTLANGPSAQLLMREYAGPVPGYNIARAALTLVDAAYTNCSCDFLCSASVHFAGRLAGKRDAVVHDERMALR